jgi:hypothetical protein
VSRFVDRGAVFAGWVGLGMAVVIAMGFELIVAVQSLVFLAAIPAGLLIGAYANSRSERRRPWKRVIANALWAGAVTAFSLAILYGGIRLLFVYADSGYRDAGQGGPLACHTGPGCTYLRYLGDQVHGPELAQAGVNDAADFERFMLQGQLNGALAIITLTLGGAVIGGALHGLRNAPTGAAAGLREAVEV